MGSEKQAEAGNRDVWFYRILAVGLILVAAVLRCIYLAWFCQLDLAGDEAHYWDWSRNLELSYYSKGPLVAYLIHVSCALLGPWSEAQFGNMMFAVRFPAVVCGSLLVLSLYVLTSQVFKRELLSLLVVMLALTMPTINAGSLIMTIDSPFCCCWGWALVLGYQAIFRKSAWAWPLLGLAIGVGILAKYNMILWVFSIFCFALFTKKYRSLFRDPGMWVALGIGALCCTPIIIWNVQNDWVGLFHVQTLAGVRNNDSFIKWMGPLAYLGTQCALLLGFGFVLWARGMWTLAPWKSKTTPEVAYLWWMSATTFLLFFGFSFKTGGGEPNWPLAAYLSGMVLAAGWLDRYVQQYSAQGKAALRGTALTSLFGLGLTFLALQPSWTLPTLKVIAGPPTKEHPLPIRKWDVTRRLRGWQTLAENVDQVNEELRKKGEEPVIAAALWQIPGELGFYCKDHPKVYSIGLAFNCRHTQYDYWHPNPVQDPKPFLGKTFIYVGAVHPRLREAFEKIGPTRRVIHKEQDYPVAIWDVTVCYGYKGFPIQTYQDDDKY